MATIQQKLDEAAAKLRAEQEISAGLKKENDRLKVIEERYESNDLSDTEKNILKQISGAQFGMQHHELAAASGIGAEVLRFLLNKLARKNFIAVHGGGNEPMRYRLDEPGANYLIAHNLI